MNVNIFVKEQLSLEIYGTVAQEDVMHYIPKEHTQKLLAERIQVRLQFVHVNECVFNKGPFGFHHFSLALWSIDMATPQESNRWYLIRCDSDHDLMKKISNTFFDFPIQLADFYFYEKRKSVISTFSVPTIGEMKCNVEILDDGDDYQREETTLIYRKGSLHMYHREGNYPPFCRNVSVDIMKDDISKHVFQHGVKWTGNGFFTRGNQVAWTLI